MSDTHNKTGRNDKDISFSPQCEHPTGVYYLLTVIDADTSVHEPILTLKSDGFEEIATERRFDFSADGALIGLVMYDSLGTDTVVSTDMPLVSLIRSKMVASPPDTCTFIHPLCLKTSTLGSISPVLHLFNLLDSSRCYIGNNDD